MLSATHKAAKSDIRSTIVRARLPCHTLYAPVYREIPRTLTMRYTGAGRLCLEAGVAIWIPGGLPLRLLPPPNPESGAVMVMGWWCAIM